MRCLLLETANYLEMAYEIGIMLKLGSDILHELTYAYLIITVRRHPF